jgi:hypothetical protein
VAWVSPVNGGRHSPIIKAQDFSTAQSKISPYHLSPMDWTEEDCFLFGTLVTSQKRSRGGFPVIRERQPNLNCLALGFLSGFTVFDLNEPGRA